MTPISRPVCIAAPVRRSGTTLIQRLLCSAENALVYGENCANDFQMMTGMVANKQSFLGHAKDWRNRQLEEVLSGAVDQWIPDLMPDIDHYLKAYEQLLETLVNVYGGFAQEKNKRVWGMKLPEWNPANLKLLQDLLQGTKIIYLHRNLKDCVRSAKGIEMVINDQELQQFCFTWKQYTDYAKEHFVGDDVLHLNYEDLIDDPKTWISRLEDFTGAVNIKSSVLATKINTYTNDQRLKEKQTFLKPASLSEQELEIIKPFE